MEDVAAKSFLSSKEIVANARKFYKENFKKLWPLYILGGLGGLLSSGGGGGGGHSSNSESSPNILAHVNIPAWVWILAGILLIAIAIFLFISKISLLKGISDTHKGEFVGVKDSYKKGLATFWSFILVGIIVGWSTLGATALLIIPGIILSVYLSFSIYELIDKQKKGFQALLGSWSLISGNWWMLVGKGFMIWVRIFSIGALYTLAILVPTLLLVIPGMVWHITALLIAGIALGVCAFFYLFVIFLTPLSMIAMFEMYYNFCEVRESNMAVDEALDKKRKRKLIISMVIGVIAIIIIIFLVIALIGYFVYKNSVKNAVSLSDYSTNSIVDKMKKNVVFPVNLDATTEMTDITAEPDAIVYHYVFSGAGTSASQITDASLKQSVLVNACKNTDIKGLLEYTNLKYLFLIKATQQTFSAIISKADCP